MTSMQTDEMTVAEIVSDHEIPCDWKTTFLHAGEGPATHVAHLTPCQCGRMGARLICNHCVAESMTTEGAAECRECGYVVAPWRHVIAFIEPISGQR